MMRGQQAREAFLKNVPGLFDTLEKLHAEKGPEVKLLLRKLRKVILAANAPSHGQDTLRRELVELRDSVMVEGYQLVVNPELFRFMLYIRHFIVATMHVLNLDDVPLPPAPAMTGTAVRRSRQQQIVLQPAAGRRPIVHPPTTGRRPMQQRRAIQQQVVVPQPRQAIQQQVVPQRQRRSVKQEPDIPDSPASSAPKNKLKRAYPATPVIPMVTAKRAPASNRRKSAPNRMKIETEPCDYCDHEIDTDPVQKVRHMFQKHKDQVYKLNPDPELVCKSVAYCDYIGTTMQARKVHEGRVHGKNPTPMDEVMEEFEKGYHCTYCGGNVYRMAFLKKHMLTCKRDQRPMLSCSACPEETFHYIIEFADHLKKKGGMTHGCPVLLPPRSGN